MKSIRVKSYNKLIENIVTEADIKLGGNIDDFKGKLKQRIVDALRLAKECKIAAKQARENGNDEDADWLEKRAEDYETAARNWNQDTIDDEEKSSADSNQDNTNKESSQAEAAQDAANAAKRAARDAQDAANEAQKAAEKLADVGQDASAAKAAADKAKEKADEAKQAAQEAQEHADEASKAEAAGDKDKAKAEAQAAEDAQKKAEQAASEAGEAAESVNQKTASERAQDAADAAEEAAKNAQAKADAAQKKADDLKAEGKDASEAQAEADRAKEKAEQAKKAAEAAKDHAEKAEEAEKSDDTDTANSEADKAEAAAENARQSANSASNSSEDDSSGSEDDSSSESNSDSNSSSKSKSKSKSNSSSSSNNKSDTSKSNGNSNDDSGDNESQSDNAPVKNPFADEEDIPSMPSMGQQGQKPRDPTIDDIIKQLGKLEGEAKRGAIAGLTDLINKNKNESLTEAFGKGIRDFSDEEWADLNDETVDRIEKIKHIDTIDNVDDIKATFKGWSENEVSRQELADEENQNIQKDALAKRAREKELDRYNNLESLHDFEIDFENCIRDQVGLVMQEYQSYDEINPEYEGEDVIMKADVQRMIPDEAIPTVAIFFDQSGSWGADDVDKGKKAIATVKQKYVDTGLCKLDIWYFAEVVKPTPYGIGCSTEAWPDIVKTIANNDYKNVVIMTDSDMNNWNNHGESYTVEGCVWWIWRHGERADKLPKQVKGMQHNFECSFS